MKTTATAADNDERRSNNGNNISKTPQIQVHAQTSVARISQKKQHKYKATTVKRDNETQQQKRESTKQQLSETIVDKNPIQNTPK